MNKLEKPLSTWENSSPIKENAHLYTTLLRPRFYSNMHAMRENWMLYFFFIFRTAFFSSSLSVCDFCLLLFWGMEKSKVFFFISFNSFWKTVWTFYVMILCYDHSMMPMCPLVRNYFSRSTLCLFLQHSSWKWYNIINSNSNNNIICLCGYFAPY
jgi:hypothetical protein